MAASGGRFRAPEPNPYAALDDLPESWEAAPLGLLLAELKYGTSKKSEYGRGGIAVLRIPNVSGERLDTSDLKYADLDPREADSLRLGVGDLLMVRSNGSAQLVGKTVLVDERAARMAYAGYLMRLRTDESAMIPAFLALVMAAPQLRRQIEMPLRSTSGVNNINTEEVRRLVVPVPSMEEQTEILRRTQALLQFADGLLVRVERARHELDRTSQAILAKAFRGELQPVGA
jgi:type I restriction enzyme S subunit